MKRLWRAVALFLLLALVGVLVVYFSASSWLETAAGRNLLQRELGKSLGLETSLQGDYALELFPGLQIAGQQLVLREPNASQPVARLESYQLHLALWPLLKKQVLIHKVEVHDGFLDIDLLQGEETVQPKPSSPDAELPRIRWLEISGLKLQKSEKELITINELLLEDFAPGRNTAISLGLSLPGDNTDPGLLQLRGSLNLTTAPLQLSLDLDELTLQAGGQAWELGRGKLGWSSASGTVVGKLDGHLAGYSSELEFSLQTTPAMTIFLSAQLLDEVGRSLSGKVSARDEAGLWRLEPVELLLEGQALAGSGCFSTEPKPRLQLKLQSSNLDLDKLQELLPDDLFASGSEPPSPSPDLPVDVAIELVAKQAIMAGVVATEARLVLGEQPDCGL